MFRHRGSCRRCCYCECPVITRLEGTSSQGLGCGEGCGAGRLISVGKIQLIHFPICTCYQVSFSVICYGYRDLVFSCIIGDSLYGCSFSLLADGVIIGSCLCVLDLSEAVSPILTVGRGHCCFSVFCFPVFICFLQDEGELSCFQGLSFQGLCSAECDFCFLGTITVLEIQVVHFTVCLCYQVSFSVICYGYRDLVFSCIIGDSLYGCSFSLLADGVIIGSCLCVLDLSEAVSPILTVGRGHCCFSVFCFPVFICFLQDEGELSCFQGLSFQGLCSAEGDSCFLRCITVMKYQII